MKAFVSAVLLIHAYAASCASTTAPLAEFVTILQQARPESAQPTFEVVSVKINTSKEPNNRIAVQPGGRFMWTNTTLKSLIGMAYQRRGFDDREILGGPDWIDSVRFDIIAKAEETPHVDPGGFPGELFAMVRGMLAERFKLSVHEETRERPIYALVLARRDGTLGPALHKSEVDCAAVMREQVQGRTPAKTPSGVLPCAVGTPPGRLVAIGLTIDMLANVLSRHAGRPVIDTTGLTGAFDWNIEFAPDFHSPLPADGPAAIEKEASDRPSIFTALQEQLGLKLESTRGTVGVLVIDHAERPTPD
jgi:bla regulator protein blaR1